MALLAVLYEDERELEVQSHQQARYRMPVMSFKRNGNAFAKTIIMENKKATLRIEDLNKGWMKSQLRSINNIIGDGKSYRERDKMCWDMFYSEQKNSSYEYLTSYGDFDIPVTVRFTSIVKPNIDWLVSKYLGNPFNFFCKNNR